MTKTSAADCFRRTLMPSPFEMLLLKEQLTPILWENISETTFWYEDDERWADEAIRRMQELGFSYAHGKTDAGVVVRLSHEKLTELAGAPERPLAVARVIALILEQSDGVELLLEN